MQTETRSIHTFQEGEIFDSRYRLVKRAGSGGFADVWKAEDTLRKNKVVALKIYTRLDEEGIKAMSEEYNETEDIQNPNLLTGNHFAAVGNIPYMEMRYCDGGSLASRVGNMDNDELRHMLRDVCTGLSYLHAEGMVHQDIKPENILFDTKHNTYLLADFGISSKTRTRLSKSAKFSDRVYSRTSEYAPPEKFSGNMVGIEPDTKGDIFSLGMTLFELATGILPFTPPMATGREMLYSQGRLQLDYSQIQDPQLRRIVEQCTKYRKEERLTAERVLALLNEPLEEPQPRQESVRKTDNTGNTSNAKRPTERIKMNGEPKLETPRLPKPPTPSPNRFWLYTGIAVAAAILLAVMLVTLLGHRSESGTLADLVDEYNTGVVETTDSQTFTVGGVDFTMVYVPGGSYTMGCTSEQGSDCYDYERPAHSVTVNGFYMGQTEVTQALWKAVMGSNPSNWKGDSLPVERVSYDDITDFLGKLNRMTGQSFRLPTEEEWEYAARGGNSSRGYKYSGGDNIGSVAWYDGNSGSRTHPVAQKQPNELGLYDMVGNVWEWCSSCWRSDYNSSANCSRRVLRGGGCYSDARRCRVSYRGSNGPSIHDGGFRLALSR